jgi:hypothetical protein
VDEFIFDKYLKLAYTPLEYFDRFFDNNELVSALPDAVYKVREANDKVLNYDVSVNDHHIWHYHRDNGFTKLSVHESKMNYTTSVLRVLEGQVEAASLVNKAYIKTNFPNTTVMTGINFYPYKFSLSKISSTIND